MIALHKYREEAYPGNGGRQEVADVFPPAGVL
jgi:hypothetical protein